MFIRVTDSYTDRVHYINLDCVAEITAAAAFGGGSLLTFKRNLQSDRHDMTVKEEVPIVVEYLEANLLVGRDR